QAELQSAFGASEGMRVTLDEGSTVRDAAFIAPSVGGQIVLFLASMYFFLATRDNIRASVLSLCVSRRLRWRVAHVFRDAEAAVSRYLLSISTVNIGLGVVVALSFWVAGLPSPLL